MSIIRSSVKAKLVVSDPDTQETWTFAVASVVATFAKNEIPTCSVELALGDHVFGRVSSSGNLSDPDLASEIFTYRRICRVFTDIEGQYTELLDWPSGDKLIFEGRSVGVSVSVTRGRAAFNLTLNHWLADLQSSSILLSYANPDNPAADTLLSASFGYNKDGEAGVTNQPAKVATIGQLSDALGLSAADFQEDLWGRGIKRRVSRILEADLLAPLASLPCDSDLNRPSAELKSAWQRIEGGDGDPLGTPYSKWASPLKMVSPDGGELDASVQASVADAIAHDPLQAYQSTDAWTRLITGFCPTYSFDVIPRVSSAIIAPEMDILRTPYCFGITENDIFQIDSFEPRIKPIGGVGVIASAVDSDGAGNIASVAKIQGLGCFAPSPRLIDGVTHYITAPPWLSRVHIHSVDAQSDVNAETIRGGTSNPGLPRKTATRVARQQSLQQADTMLNRYARTKYNQLALRGRSAKIIGRLRFDIGPGSTIAVQAIASQIRGVQKQAPSFIGLVTRLTIVIDAQRKMATTMYQMQHVRSEIENESDAFASDEHPFYKTVFRGAPLTDDYAIPFSSSCP